MDYFIGQILLLPYTFAPLYTLYCNGAVISVNEYQALYSLIGNTYGGTPGVTFALPNLQGAEPLPGLKYCIVTQGMYPQRP